MTVLRVLAANLDHPEGVAWDPQGVLVTGGEAGQLWHIDPNEPDSPILVGETGGFCLGMAVDSAGRIFVCDMEQAAVIAVDPKTGAADVYSQGTTDRPMRVPNYPAFAPDGTLYVSDSGSYGDNDGCIFAIAVDGSTRLASESPAGFPNGVALSPESTHLFVVETTLPGVSRLEIRPDGSLGDRVIELTIPGTVPDGIAFTSHGRLLISCYRPDTIFLWDGASLELLAEDRTGLTLSAPTNVAFFGSRLDRLCSANLAGRHLTEISTDLEGLPLHYPDIPT